jgi:acetyl-CoA C-acetyltransferase
VVEVSDLYAYQQPMWLEGLGVCDAGTGGVTVSTAIKGKPAINPSGGTLAGNPMLLGGLVRAAEASLQLMGRANGHQVENAATALAHGVMGPAGQFHSVVTLARG